MKGKKKKGEEKDGSRTWSVYFTIVKLRTKSHTKVLFHPMLLTMVRVLIFLIGSTILTLTHTNKDLVIETDLPALYDI